VRDRGEHAVRGAGNAAGSGPAVHVAWPTGEGRSGTWQGGDFKVPRSALSLGKARPQEGAGGPDAEAVVRRIPAAKSFIVP
jgi:hypothetical protein